MMNWYGIPTNYYYYTCVHRILAIGSTDTVEGVLEKHLPGKLNTDVEAFFVHDQPLTFVPKNIITFFPNIVAISLNSTGLENLSIDDLEDFPSLKNLHVNYNKLETLPSNLFRHNSKLETILIWNNNLRHVGFNLIDHLTKLKAAQIMNSPCINFSAENSVALTELSYKLSVYCPPTLEMFKTSFAELERIQVRRQCRISLENRPTTALSAVTDRRNQHEITRTETVFMLKALMFSVIGFVICDVPK